MKYLIALYNGLKINIQKNIFILKVVKKYQNSLRKKKIFIIRNKKNLGCGTGHNIGYKFAIKIILNLYLELIII